MRECFPLLGYEIQWPRVYLRDCGLVDRRSETPLLNGRLWGAITGVDGRG
jgi:hypothetical protein